jgi:transposase-like protein
MMAERGVSVAPSTILRRVKHYAPEFETRWDRFARPVGGSSRWTRPTAAKAFFRKALTTQGRRPRTITLDGYQASHRAIRELCAEDRKLRSILVRSCQYFNNFVEQDHRNIKSRLRPILGFKQFENAVSTIAGVELIQHGTVRDASDGFKFFFRFPVCPPIEGYRTRYAFKGQVVRVRRSTISAKISSKVVIVTP